MADNFHNDFRKRQKDFDRRFNAMNRVFWVVFGVVSVLVVSWCVVVFSITGYTLFQAHQAGPEGAGNFIGRFIKAIMDGAGT